MKKYKIISAALLCACFATLFSLTALANSSWVWISETRPFDILPIVIFVTLAIETAATCFFADISKTAKAFCVIALANICSFLLPYLLWIFGDGGISFPLEKYIDNWPSYSVGMVYLIATLAVELPITWIFLRADAAKPKRLFITVAAVNTLTTVIVAATERLICKGTW